MPNSRGSADPLQPSISDLVRSLWSRFKPYELAPISLTSCGRQNTVWQVVKRQGDLRFPKAARIAYGSGVFPNEIPKPVKAERHKMFFGEATPSGDGELDALLGGGLERGTTALLIGGAGVGESSIALTYAGAAAERGERFITFAFDEGLVTIYARAAGLGLRLHPHAGTIRLQQIDPAEMSPGEAGSGVITQVNALSLNYWYGLLARRIGPLEWTNTT